MGQKRGQVRNASYQGEKSHLYKWVECIGNLSSTLTMLLALYMAVWQIPQLIREDRVRWQYDAWSIIHEAKDQRRSIGRQIAVEELVARGVSLEHIDLSKAEFNGAKLDNANFTGAILMGTAFALEMQFEFGKARQVPTSLKNAQLQFANLEDALLLGCDLGGANLAYVNFKNADLSYSNLNNVVNWQLVESFEGTNLFGIKAPAGFIEFARGRHAISEPRPERHVPVVTP